MEDKRSSDKTDSLSMSTDDEDFLEEITLDENDYNPFDFRKVDLIAEKKKKKTQSPTRIGSSSELVDSTKVNRTVLMYSFVRLSKKGF
jgi:hypothetical protein